MLAAVPSTTIPPMPSRSPEFAALSTPRWAALVEDAPFYVAVIDASGQLTFLNRTRGSDPPGSYVGRPVAELLPPGDGPDFAALVARVSAEGRPTVVEVPARIAEQQTVWLDVHLLPIRSGPEAGGVLAIGIDVTADRQVALELRMSVNALHRVIEWRERLGADLHDGILQSLYGVGLSIEAARAALADSGSEAGTHLNRAVTQVRDAMSQVRRFITDGPGTVPEPAGWSEALSGLLRGLEVAGGPAIVLDIDRRAVVRVAGAHQSELAFIAREAVSNAVRHAEASRVVVRLLDDGPRIRLEVEDDGRGLDGTRSGSGLGLLSMTRRAAHIGAQIAFQTLPGHGTLVRLDLPVDEGRR